MGSTGAAKKHRPLSLLSSSVFLKTLAAYLWARARPLAMVMLALLALPPAVQRWGPVLVGRLHSAFLGLPRPKRVGMIRRKGGILVPGASPDVQLATVFYIRDDLKPAPTMLIRTPYNKVLTEGIASAIAVQGFNVVLQDCRGRFGSTGSQTFAAYEDQDGTATLLWLANQGYSWFDPNRVVMFGISYLGIVQWALVAGIGRLLTPSAVTSPAASAEKALEPGQAESSSFAPLTEEASPPGEQIAGSNGQAGTAGLKTAQLAAIAPLFCASRVHSVFFRNNTFTMDFYVRYIYLMTRGKSLMAMLCSIFDTLSFEVRLQRSLRRCVALKQLHHELGIPYLFRYNSRTKSRFWQNRDYSDAVSYAPPALIASGWYDIFLEGSLDDFEALQSAHGVGHSRLLIGPWHHLETMMPGPFSVLLAATLEFLSEQIGLREAEDPLRPPVRLWIMGQHPHKGKWRDFREWPPKEVDEEVLLVGPGGLQSPHDDSLVDGWELDSKRCSIIYDPLNPTPALGGSQFSPVHAGVKDQRTLERREDVMIFDSKPLSSDLTVVGHVKLRLSVKASHSCFDIFARLCDVHPSGTSYNVCDAVLRTKAALERAESEQDMSKAHSLKSTEPFAGAGDGSVKMSLDLTFSATAKCFMAGHRIRLLIAGGAFPYIMRNFGDVEQACLEEPLQIRTCELSVLSTESCPTSLWLPVLQSGGGETPHATGVRRRRSLREAAAARARRYSGRESKADRAGLRKTLSECLMAQGWGSSRTSSVTSNASQ